MVASLSGTNRPSTYVSIVPTLPESICLRRLFRLVKPPLPGASRAGFEPAIRRSSRLQLEANQRVHHAPELGTTKIRAARQPVHVTGRPKFVVEVAQHVQVIGGAAPEQAIPDHA